MNENFIEVDKSKWSRAQEFENFSKAPCSFSVTAEIDITNLYAYSKQNGKKLYPLLVAVSAQAINSRKEFRYHEFLESGRFGYFEVLHPIVFQLNKNSNDTKALVAEYDRDLNRQLDNIDSVRRQYEDIDGYMPQEYRPINAVNISCVPWLKFTDLSFSLTYGAKYYFPILTFGKFTKQDGKVVIPLSVFANHAVNDGYHVAMLFADIEERIKSLTTK